MLWCAPTFALTAQDPRLFHGDALVTWQFTYIDQHGHPVDPDTMHFVVFLRNEADPGEQYFANTTDGHTREMRLSTIVSPVPLGVWRIWVAAVSPLGEAASESVWARNLGVTTTTLPPTGPQPPFGLDIIELVPE